MKFDVFRRRFHTRHQTLRARLRSEMSDRCRLTKTIEADRSPDWHMQMANTYLSSAFTSLMYYYNTGGSKAVTWLESANSSAEQSIEHFRLAGGDDVAGARLVRVSIALAIQLVVNIELEEESAARRLRETILENIGCGQFLLVPEPQRSNGPKPTFEQQLETHPGKALHDLMLSAVGQLAARMVIQSRPHDADTLISSYFQAVSANGMEHAQHAA